MQFYALMTIAGGGGGGGHFVLRLSFCPSVYLSVTPKYICIIKPCYSLSRQSETWQIFQVKYRYAPPILGRKNIFDKITVFSNLEIFQKMATTGFQVYILNSSHSFLANNLKHKDRSCRQSVGVHLSFWEGKHIC